MGSDVCVGQGDDVFRWRFRDGDCTIDECVVICYVGKSVDESIKLVAWKRNYVYFRLSLIKMKLSEMMMFLSAGCHILI